MDTIRYGIVGTGLMGCEHIRNIALLPDAEVTAVADPSSRSLEWAQVAAGHELELYDDHRRLLASAPVDALVIASPNHTHAAVLDDLWGSDKHLLIEKPVCTTREDCRRVERAASEHEGIVQVGMEYRYMPPIARLIEEVHAGTVGQLHMLAIREHRFPFLSKVDDWNRFNRNTGGTLVEKCCHFFDLMRLITAGEPRHVFASGGQSVNHLDESYGGEVPDLLDNAYVVVDFEGGVRALLDLCMFAEGSRNQEEICAVGDRAKIECFIPESTLVISRRSPKQVQAQPVDVDSELLAAGHHHGATYYQHLAFLRSIREGAPVEVTIDDGVRAVEMGLAAHRSIDRGVPISLSNG